MRFGVQQTDLPPAGRLNAAGIPRHAAARRVMRWTMAAFYMIAGAAHLALGDKFLRIVPNWVPLPGTVVLITGVCEIAGAAALPSRRFARLAGVMLALYAVCVFPANLKHAHDDLRRPAGPANRWYHGPRLALQPVLVWWALFCVGIIDWPFGPIASQVAGQPGPPGRGGRKLQQIAHS